MSGLSTFRTLTVSLLASAALASTLHAQSVGEAAIRAVHARWNGKTYRTMTFVQETQYPDGRRETWFESIKAPGHLRIDINPGDSTARMMLFRADSLYQGRAGRPVVGRPYVHPLMVLYTDITSSNPSETIAKISKMGIDLSKSRDDQFLGKAVLVIGAGVGDTVSSQFWIEKDRQLVVRLIEKESRPGAGRSDTQVLKYDKIGDQWVESEITFHVGGKLVQRELYNETKLNVTLDDSIFQPSLSNVPTWIGTRKPR